MTRKQKQQQQKKKKKKKKKAKCKQSMCNVVRATAVSAVNIIGLKLTLKTLIMIAADKILICFVFFPSK